MNKLLLSLNVVCAPWFSISKETDSAVLSSQRWKYSLLNPVAFPIPSSTITKNGFSLGVTKKQKTMMNLMQKDMEMKI